MKHTLVTTPAAIYSIKMKFLLSIETLLRVFVRVNHCISHFLVKKKAARDAIY